MWRIETGEFKRRKMFGEPTGRPLRDNTVASCLQIQAGDVELFIQEGVSRGDEPRPVFKDLGRKPWQYLVKQASQYFVGIRAEEKMVEQ